MAQGGDLSLSITLDRSSPTFEADLTAFVERGKTAAAQVGADAPVCTLREEGTLLHIQVIPASRKRGGVAVPAQGNDGYRKTSVPLMDLKPTASSNAPEGSPELAADVKAMLRKFRG